MRHLVKFKYFCRTTLKYEKQIEYNNDNYEKKKQTKKKTRCYLIPSYDPVF